MPKGQAIDIEALKVLQEVEVKKESETTRTSLFTPATGKRFRLLGFTLFSSAETSVSLEDGETVFFVVGIAAKTSITINLATLPASGYLSVTPGAKLQYKSFATAKFTGVFYGIEDVA